MSCSLSVLPFKHTDRVSSLQTLSSEGSLEPPVRQFQFQFRTTLEQLNLVVLAVYTGGILDIQTSALGA